MRCAATLFGSLPRAPSIVTPSFVMPSLFQVVQSNLCDISCQVSSQATQDNADIHTVQSREELSQDKVSFVDKYSYRMHIKI